MMSDVDASATIPATVERHNYRSQSRGDLNHVWE